MIGNRTLRMRSKRTDQRRTAGNTHHSKLETLEGRVLLSSIYVDASAVGPAPDGASWASAYPDLQMALGKAQSGDRILVADGTYKPTSTTDRAISFNLKRGVAIYGGYAGYGAANPDARNVSLYPSILSGDIGAVGDKSDNSYHVLTANGVDATAILDGFTITGGNATGADPDENVGGGMYNYYSSPTLSHCTFTDNSALFGGGGMYNSSPTSSSPSSCSPTFSNCTFNGNSAGTCGGGIYNYSYGSLTLSNCIFSGNSAGLGGGIYNITFSSPVSTTSTLSNCTFIGNSASGGGGIYTHSSLTLTNCTFTSNSASGEGGGAMYNDSCQLALANCTFTGNSASCTGPSLGGGNGGGIYNSGSSLTLSNCTFNGNRAFSNAYGGSGGGVYNYYYVSETLNNCTFVGNSASSHGGGMYNGSSSDTLSNCTFSGNSAGIDGGGMYNSNLSSPRLTNCILWGNTAASSPQIYNYAGNTFTVSYSDIQDGCPGTGNISADPLFVRYPSAGADGAWGTADDDYGDLRLRFPSPAIDAGDNAAVPSGTATDLAGNSRFQDIATLPDSGPGTGAIVDMGAYEAAPALAADAGGPYYVPQGQNITFGGRGMSDATGTLQYAWEWSGDGQYDDATGPSPIFSSTGWPLSAPITISLRVTDSASRSITSTTTLTVVTPILYVDGNAPGDNSGASWSNAFTSLADALAHALPSQQIRVADGTYKPTSGTDRTISFNLKNGVAIYGGYAGYGASNPDTRDALLYSSVLSGDIGVAGDSSDNSYHVLYSSGVDATAVLDGFTITAGNANGIPPYSNGGGIYNTNASPTLSNCTVSGNSADNDGGGMYNNYASPALSNCKFAGNSAAYGGGIFNIYASPTLRDCTVSANSASSGGGMYNGNSSSPTLTNCAFTGNSADEGGGVYNYSSSAAFTNCTFSGNSAVYRGAGIRDNSASATLANCVLWGNVAPASPQIFHGTGTLTITYSDIQGGWAGTGNINADPLFVRSPSPGPDGTWGTADDDYGDLRLQVTSPAIDAGDNAAVPSGITTDLAGNSRFQNVLTIPDTGSGTAPLVDMGAYENQGGRDNLILADGAVMTLTADQHLASLSISGNAKLNLKDHELLVDSVDLMQVRSWIQSGVLFSDATIPGKSMALGYASSGEGVLVKYTYRGDADLDGDVDGDDVAKWAVNFTGSLTNPANPKAWTQGDWDYDGDVDGDDVAKWAVNFTGALTSGGLSEDEPQPALVSSPVAQPQVGPAPVSVVQPPVEAEPVSGPAPLPASLSVTTARRYHQPAMQHQAKTASPQFRQGPAIRASSDVRGDGAARSSVQINPLFQAKASFARDRLWAAAEDDLLLASSR